MNDIVIKVENIGKQYRLGQVGTGTLVSDLNSWWYKVRRKEDPNIKLGEINKGDLKGKGDLVWVLNNLNFEVRRGEVFGIIGKNGAGKSTLLKILSKVTSPSTGTVKIKGRIASLLEVGTGFHPDLSGRENIYLNGAILGMRKHEINAKFDEIVEFSGVERYIDTPVKRYSSGMYVRLAFAVAAHLEPEILIVDEVLAVGDIEFQKKCLGRMKEVSQEGRTVLFVSHNLEAVNSLCSKTICLKNGSIDFIGETSLAINRYLSKDSQNDAIEDFRIKELKYLGKRANILDIKKLSEHDFFEYGQPLRYQVKIHSKEKLEGVRIIYGIYNSRELVVGVAFPEESFDMNAGEIKTVEFSVQTNNTITPDNYLSSIGIIQGSMLNKFENLDIIFGYPTFDVLPSRTQGVSINNMMNWRKVWGNVIIPSNITKIY
jgi:lipopolysaccharide transport system ATP-binding protein